MQREYHPSLPKPQTPRNFKTNQGRSFKRKFQATKTNQQTHKTSHRSAEQTPSSNNQQQPTAIRRQKNRNRRKSQKEEMKNKDRTCGYLYIIIYTKNSYMYLSKIQDDRTSHSRL
jgi:hypothetical protein